MILFDLEWNRGYDKIPLDEILQIGAVKTAFVGGPILDTFQRYIGPRVHRSYSPGAKKLPDLPQCLASTLTFGQALDDFLAWCGDETVFASWGGDDAHILEQNCAYWKLPVPKLPKSYNLQRAFSEVAGAGKQQMALWRAVEYCGLPALFDFHSALNDSMYTALLAQWVPEEVLFAPPPAKEPKVKHWTFSKLAFTPPPRLRAGPFPKVEALLDTRPIRRPLCPLCGTRLLVQCWYGPLGQQYFAPFRCPAHGRFLCRLTAAQDEDGQWRGRVSVPPITPELQWEFHRAAAQPPRLCRAKRKSHRRRGKKKTAPQA